MSRRWRRRSRRTTAPHRPRPTSSGLLSDLEEIMMSLVSYEPSPDIEAVAEQLRDRGFDARAFTDTDEMFVHLESGVAIHGICVLGWRYPDERWGFTDHPARLIAPDEHDPIARS